MRKNIDLSEKCVKDLSKKAVDLNTNFKVLAQSILEYVAKNPEKITLKKLDF